jgi:uncharacterized repeat protein (TIGR03803 family)
MTQLNRWKMGCALLAFCAATAMLSPAQVTRIGLKSFDGTDGANPGMVLTQGADGSLYGTTAQGGSNNNACASGCGTVFKIPPKGGTLTTLYNFCSQTGCTDGSSPMSSLVQAADGNFYGTTYFGGNTSECLGGGCGTVFKITPAGTLTTLYAFCALANCADGELPYAGLVQDRNGNFYGTTVAGGANNGGTVFEITPTGKLTTLYNFCSLLGCADGYNPLGELVQGSNGNFYGDASGPYGTIFEMTPGGKLTTLFTFDGTDGASPIGGLIQAANGDFYGVAAYGSSSGYCPFNYGCGTVFKITPRGEFTTLYNFCSQTNCPDGEFPYGPLVQGTDGNFYGITRDGGTFDGGTAFAITPDGALTTLFSFCTLYLCMDGGFPSAGLLQDTNGTFYGTTYYGGKYHPRGTIGYGTIFHFSTGLGPFVETVPTSGKMGTAVEILGTNLTGAASVTFNGAAAKFRVVSKSEIKTTVPEGATTGTVKVKTPNGTLKSNVVFRVKP